MGALKKSFLVLMIGGSIASSALALTVSTVSINQTSSTPIILVKMDQPYSLQFAQENPETILVQFPQGTRWNTSRSVEAMGSIKSYTYIPYQDTSGELIIKLDPSLKIKQAGTAPNGVFGISFTPSSFPSSPLIEPPSSEPPDQSPRGTLTVSSISVNPPSSVPTILVKMNQPYSLKFAQENPETILVQFPQGTRWNTSVSGETMSQIKSYTYLPYEDSSGELVIKIDPSLKIKQAGTASNGIFGISFTSPALSSGALQSSSVPLLTSSSVPLVINNFRMGQKDGKTRLVLEMNKPINFTLKERADGSIVLLTPSEPAKWQLPVSTPYGLFKGYRLVQNGTETALEVSLVPGTQIAKSGLIDSSPSTPRFVVDLASGMVSMKPLDSTALAPYEMTKFPTKLPADFSPNVGKGLYVGAQLNQITASNDSQSNANSLIGLTQNHSQAGIFGGGVSLFGGYGFNHDRFYGGIELNAGYSHLESREKATDNTATRSSTSKIDFSWGGSARLGWYLSPTNLLYTRLGVINTTFSYSGRDSENGSVIFPGSFKEDNHTGILYGVGLESKLNDRLSVRIEGTQSRYPTIKTQNPAGSTNRSQYLLNQASVGLSYHLKPLPISTDSSSEEKDIGTGFYVGGDGGIGNMTLEGKAKSPNNQYEGDRSVSKGSFGVFGGYSLRKDRFFMALEASLDLGQKVLTENQIGTHGGGYYITTTYKLKNLWALTVRPGYIFNNDTLLYGRLGLMGGRMSGYRVTYIPAFKADFKKEVTGIRIGGGLETFLNSHFSLRADYTLDYIPNISVPSSINIGGFSDQPEKITLINNQIKLGLSFIF